MKNEELKGKKSRLSLEQRLAKALTHPLRVQCLSLMNAREWSPRELSDELNEGLSQVSYHVKVLKDFELIELSKTIPRRGAVEHYYRALERPFVRSGRSKDIPKSAQRIIGNGIIQELDNDIDASLKSGSFYKRDDWHTSWTPVDLDGIGCEDVEKLADEFVDRLIAIEAEAINRRSNDEGDGAHIWTAGAALVFGSEIGAKSKKTKRPRVDNRRKREGRSRRRQKKKRS